MLRLNLLGQRKIPGSSVVRVIDIKTSVNRLSRKVNMMLIFLLSVLSFAIIATVLVEQVTASTCADWVGHPDPLEGPNYYIKRYPYGNDFELVTDGSHVTKHDFLDVERVLEPGEEETVVEDKQMTTSLGIEFMQRRKPLDRAVATTFLQLGMASCTTGLGYGDTGACWPGIGPAHWEQVRFGGELTIARILILYQGRSCVDQADANSRVKAAKTEIAEWGPMFDLRLALHINAWAQNMHGVDPDPRDKDKNTYTISSPFAVHYFSKNSYVSATVHSDHDFKVARIPSGLVETGLPYKTMAEFMAKEVHSFPEYNADVHRFWRAILKGVDRALAQVDEVEGPISTPSCIVEKAKQMNHNDHVCAYAVSLIHARSEKGTQVKEGPQDGEKPHAWLHIDDSDIFRIRLSIAVTSSVSQFTADVAAQDIVASLTGTIKKKAFFDIMLAQSINLFQA